MDTARLTAPERSCEYALVPVNRLLPELLLEALLLELLLPVADGELVRLFKLDNTLLTVPINYSRPDRANRPTGPENFRSAARPELSERAAGLV